MTSEVPLTQKTVSFARNPSLIVQGVVKVFGGMVVGSLGWVYG